MSIPEDLKYTKEHEWVRVESGTGTMGISKFASEQLGDVVYVELPEVGKEVKQGDTIGSIESVKAVSDIYSPISGTISEVNNDLSDGPEKINEDPYDSGWIAKINISDDDSGNLLTPEDYGKHIQE